MRLEAERIELMQVPAMLVVVVLVATGVVSSGCGVPKVPHAGPGQELAQRVETPVSKETDEAAPKAKNHAGLVPTREEVAPELISAAASACDMPRYRTREEACRHGLVPESPFEECAALVSDEAFGRRFGFQLHSFSVPFGGGHAEMFLRAYVGSGSKDYGTVFLAFVDDDGSVSLLAELFEFSGDTLDYDVPVFEADRGLIRVKSVVEQLDKDDTPVSVTRELECRPAESGWKCPLECPQLGANPLDGLACADLRRAGGTRANRLTLKRDEWFGGWVMDSAFQTACDAAGGVYPDACTSLEEPVSYRRITSRMPTAWRGHSLHVLELRNSVFVLSDGRVPLVVGGRLFELSASEGRLIVGSESDGKILFTEVDLATHRVSDPCTFDK